MMNKKEVIEKINNITARETFMSEIIWVKRDEVLDIIKQLDEPEKPVVPQFVADWYEDNKNDFEWEVYQLCVKYHEYELEGEIKNWFGSMDNKSIETLVLMHKFGYEVEKEKLYTVELPNPNYQDSGSFVLRKDKKDKVLLDWHYSKILKELDGIKLTEAEIKKDFEWAWQFAKEVTE